MSRLKACQTGLALAPTMTNPLQEYPHFYSHLPSMPYNTIEPFVALHPEALPNNYV